MRERRELGEGGGTRGEGKGDKAKDVVERMREKRAKDVDRLCGEEEEEEGKEMKERPRIEEGRRGERRKEGRRKWWREKEATRGEEER